MRRIIALRGKGGSGKTTTIRLLHTLLLQNNFILISTTFNPLKGDFISIFSKNEKKIGIASSGDTYDLVHDRLQQLINANCTICICACRTFDLKKPGTNSAILEFTNYRNEFIEKTVDQTLSTIERTNSNDAQILLARIQSLL